VCQLPGRGNGEWDVPGRREAACIAVNGCPWKSSSGEDLFVRHSVLLTLSRLNRNAKITPCYDVRCKQ